MKDTRSDGRSRESLGSLMVWQRENAGDNSLQMERIRRNLHRALEAELTPRQRQMVALYYDQGLTMAEIGKLLEVQPSTVCRTLQRAMRRLQNSLRYAL